MSAAMPDTPLELEIASDMPPNPEADRLEASAKTSDALRGGFMLGMGKELPLDARCVGCWITTAEAQITAEQIAGLPETPEPQ